jgi:superfamily II DNA or RNA helicase
MLVARPYQFRFLTGIVDVLRSRAAGLVLALATGSGKSVVVLAAAALAHRERLFTRCLVVVPSVDLLNQFASYDGATLQLPHPLLDGTTEVALPRVQVLPAGNRGKALADWFDATRDRHDEPAVGVVTMDTLRLCYQTRLIHNYTDFTGTLLVLDEGHHVYGGDLLGANSTMIHGFRALGAKTIQATATPIRHDGRPTSLVGPDGIPDPIFERSMLEHLLEGYTPALHARCLEVGGTALPDQDGMLRPGSEQDGIAILVSSWEQDDKPLALVRDQCADTMTNQRTRELIRDAFDQVGGNCLVLTNCMDDAERARWESLKVALRERRSYQEIREIANVVVVHQMANEGVDLPAFSNLFFWGVPRSMPVVQQMTGRVMRQRVDSNGTPLYAGYPARWLTNSKITFCTTNVSAGSSEEAELVCQVFGWCASLVVGSFLSLILRHGVALQFLTSSGSGSPDSQRTAEVTRSLEQTIPYILQANCVVDQICRDPLNDITPARRVALLTEVALQLMGRDQSCEVPEDDRREVAQLAARAHLAKESGQLAQVPDGPPIDARTRQIVAETQQEFAAEALSEHGYTLQAEVGRVFNDMAARTGLRANVQEVLGKVQAFRALHGRLPGSLGRPLTQEPVPGESFSFDRYAHHPWRQVILEQISQTDRMDQARQARLRWGSDLARRPPSIQSFQASPSNRDNPLVLYGLEALWVPVGPWLAEWTWSDWSALGAWAGAGCRLYRDNARACQHIERVLSVEGPVGLLRRVRTGCIMNQEAG